MYDYVHVYRVYDFDFNNNQKSTASRLEMHLPRRACTHERIYAEMDDNPKTQRFQLHVLDGWCGGIIIASLQQTQTTLIAAVK